MNPRFRKITIPGALTALVVYGWLLIDQVQPRPLTQTHMHMMKRRILRFATANGSLPTSLAQLPQIEGFANEMTDGWGRPILWRIDGADVILTSYGRDGLPGGIGEDADLIGISRTKLADGRWVDELCDWQRNPGLIGTVQINP